MLFSQSISETSIMGEVRGGKKKTGKRGEGNEAYVFLTLNNEDICICMDNPSQTLSYESIPTMKR